MILCIQSKRSFRFVDIAAFLKSFFVSRSSLAAPRHRSRRGSRPPREAGARDSYSKARTFAGMTVPSQSAVKAAKAGNSNRGRYALAGLPGLRVVDKGPFSP